MIRCIIKILFIITIFVSIYLLYNRNVVENLENICAKCFVNPRDNNCIRIKEFKMKDTNDIYNLNVELVDTSYVFCPWTNNCDISENNILTQEERLKLSNEELNQQKAFKTENKCCNNSGTDSNFYANHVSSYSENQYVKSNKEKCQKLDTLIRQNRDILDPTIMGDDYYKVRTLCNFNTDLSGSLFFIEKDNKYTNILENQELTVDDILKMQNRLEIRYNTNNEQEKAELRTKIRTLNEELKTLNMNTTIDKNRKIEIQKELKNYFSNIENSQFIYKLVDNNNNILNTYTVYDNEGYNCFGNKEKLDKDISQNVFDDFFAQNTRFSVSSDATYKTQQDFLETNYPSQRDLELEMKNLPKLDQTGNAPVSVINQYMSSINRFYEKQLDNMLGPKTHTVPKKLEFDNDGLAVTDKFFTYENKPNNTFECSSSVTGNDKFKDCGPPAYYNPLSFS